ncbi:signal recognition particle [Streptomonospora alba]|uniref:Signal recognition particle n=1 Tax=Streptomonospora alba TaxID=183763 RepID=A0A0C2JFN7_9ACTN|nr:hypothetical protein [Streptomonospora alba]KIH97640.1 signal recognition particle [Streptomonospora alba]
MRDRSSWHGKLLVQLNDAWPNGANSFRPGDLLDVELGLYLLGTALPGHAAADTWTLFDGYPYSQAFGGADTPDELLRIRRARYYLTAMRRPREWIMGLRAYIALPVELRGYELDSPEDTPQRRSPSRAAKRFDVYEHVLTTPPPFARRRLPVAEADEYRFKTKDRTHSVKFDEALLKAAGGHSVPVPAHDFEAPPTLRGSPISVRWDQLRAAAREMDAREQALPGVSGGRWAERLERVELRVRDEPRGQFRGTNTFTIQGLAHLVGMVGAGKSTLRDILTFWAATKRGARMTVVVSDVAETLDVVNRFAHLGVRAAPVLGHSTRERNAARLHHRLANGEATSPLEHTDEAFRFLSSACPVDALRGTESHRPLRLADAPCGTLLPVARHEERGQEGAEESDESVGARLPAGLHELDSNEAAAPPPPEEKSTPHACPLWGSCPRNIGARELTEAQVWVSTPAGLVHSGVPAQMNEERIRYLELAARRSDIVIVDEADRVQMLLDTAFAPSATLVGRSPNSWLDEVSRHKVAELAGQGRIQLSARDVDDWTNAVDTVASATDRCYSLLVNDADLRSWITKDYFSALTLHQWLMANWFPDLLGTEQEGVQEGTEVEAATERRTAMEHVEAALDRFRDAPLQTEEPTGPDDQVTADRNRLSQLALELLHALHGSETRQRLRQVLSELVQNDEDVLAELDLHAVRFEFTLLLAALHHHLNIMTTLWPRVEAALNLHDTSNVLSRRPPPDYDPVIPESPMGNVLGFQFQGDDRVKDGVQSGELRFFRCNGVGRELLLTLPHLPEVDDRTGPNVLLMSATSWAGTSSRYHLHTPVTAVLRPREEEAEAILRTRFEKLPLYCPDTSQPLRLSGSPTPELRSAALKKMLHQLAVPPRGLPNAKSLLQQELDELDDPDRRRALLLVGSYSEAKEASEYLDGIPEWRGRVVRLVPDEADLDDTWMTLRRGDVSDFASSDQGHLLVAPLLAVERGHNIVLRGGKAAIGSVYFLARPHPRPDDIALAVQAINDWAVRQIRGVGYEFRRTAQAAPTPHEAGLAFRSRARRQWNRYLTRRLAWSSLPEDEKTAFTWDQLVVIWQVIGRLVRGGVPARAVFVDAAFFPQEAAHRGEDTPRTGLLAGMHAVLGHYFNETSDAAAIDRSLVEALYEPLFTALSEID